MSSANFSRGRISMANEILMYLEHKEAELIDAVKLERYLKKCIEQKGVIQKWFDCDE